MLAVASITKALKGVATFEQIAAKYETDHELVFSTVEAKADGSNSSLNIVGQFLDRRSGRYVGKFVRKLQYANNAFAVHHGILEIEISYWRRGIAKGHYRRAFSLYRDILNVTRVTMDAKFMGPYVWGDFGFEFSPEDWDLMMRRFDQIHQTHCGAAAAYYRETATGLRHYRAEDGFAIGEEAIRAVHAARGTLKMVLNFNDSRSTQVLIDKGIL